MFIMLVVIILFSTIMINREYQEFEREAERIHERFIQNQKDTIVFDTRRVLTFIEHAYQSRDLEQDEETVKKQIMYAIEELYGRQDSTGYIFIYDFKGKVLSDPIQRENVGKNLYNIKDANGVMVIKDLIEVSRHKEGGFVEYQWLKPTSGMLSPKISYAKSFEPWGWMVGTGVYLDEAEKHIQEEREILKDRLNHYSMKVLFLLVILFTVGILGIILINKILHKEVSTFNRYFEEASSKYAMINPDKIRLFEFQRMVPYINAMVKVIHERKQKLKELNLTLEQKVEQKTKDLREQNALLEKEKDFNAAMVKAQDSFIKHSIHEINTPLAVIMTHIDLFKMKVGENRFLSKIEAASKIIANIYADLSYMVKKDRFDYQKTMFSLSEFLEERVDFFAEIASGNKHKIITQITPGLMIKFSEEELQRIIDNNLSNAIKYAYRGTDIKIVLQEENTNILLQFIGHSPKIEDTERIFRAFERENNVRGGFGLGLEIVYTICQKEGVEIAVHSDGEITIFSYKFAKRVLDESVVA